MDKEPDVITTRLLDELKERLTSAFGHRLYAVVLFGSEARGEAGPDSDIDLLAVLETQSGDYGDELERGLVAGRSARSVRRPVAWPPPWAARPGSSRSIPDPTSACSGRTGSPCSATASSSLPPRVPRWQLIVFTYAAALLFVAGLLGLLVFATWLVTGLLTGLWSPGILALPTLLLFFAMLLGVSVFKGVVTRSAVAAMLVMITTWGVLFVVGLMHMQVVASRIRAVNAGRPRPVSVADALRPRAPSRQGRPQQPAKDRTPFHTTTVARVVETSYAVLPHTEDLDTMVDRQLMRDFAVGGRLRQLIESPDFKRSRGVGLTLAHTAAFLLAACVVFSRRDP